MLRRIYAYIYFMASHIYMYVFMYGYLRMYIHMYGYFNMYVHIRAYMHEYIHTCMLVVLNTHISEYARYREGVHECVCM